MKITSNLNSILQKCLNNYTPPPSITVSQHAERTRRLSKSVSSEAGLWRNSRTPYLVRPMDLFTDPRVHEITLMFPSQAGKALDVNTVIPTPKGWTRMGDLKKGDIVFDEKGNQCKVVFATETMYNHKCYEVTFSDGNKIVADAEHKWYVEFDKKNAVKTTQELIKDYKFGKTRKGNQRNRYHIPVAKPLDCEEKDLLIKPYTLGVWLGDGHSYSSYFCGHLDDFEIVENVRKDGYIVEVTETENRNYEALIDPKKVQRICKRGHDTKITGLTKQGYCLICSRQYALKHKWNDKSKLDPIVRPLSFFERLQKYNLIKNKHIPQDYFRASKEQRLELLRGLMDTDGCINKDGSAEICLKSKRLIEDVSELLVSLGIKNAIHEKKAVCTNGKIKKVCDVYRINFTVYNDMPICKLTRKRERQVSRENRRPYKLERRSIVNIVEVETRPVRCIQVDSPNHLYLAGKGMIPTHNTEVILNCENYIIDVRPKGILHILPNDDSAKDFSMRRVSPFINDNPQIKRKMNGLNGIYKKQFAGGATWTIAGANVPSDVCSAPCETCFIDEYDRTGESCGKEGEVRGLVKARMITFPNHKMVTVSTPTIEGQSKIQKIYNQGTREHWKHQCPKCKEWNAIRFASIKFDYEMTLVDRVKTYKVKWVKYECPNCKHLTDEQETKELPQKWIADNPEMLEENGHASFWMSGFYSPWLHWKEMILEFLQAGKDPSMLQPLFNTKFCELWQQYGDMGSEDEYMRRRELYDAELPEGVLFLTCGVDTQDNRLEYEVVGHGFHNEKWGIKKGIIIGRPSRADTWNRLDDVLNHNYTFKNGKALKIGITLVDSGGHYAPEVKRACRNRQHLNVFAIKGTATSDLNTTAPYVSLPKLINVEKDNPNEKCWLYTINVNHGKHFIYDCLKVKEQGEMFYHFPSNPDAGYDERYFNGLLSEVEVIRNNRVQWVVLQGHERNEPLDCRNYANAGFVLYDPDLEAQYNRLHDINNNEELEETEIEDDYDSNYSSGESFDWE